ncbi:hypothetical protein PTKU64_91570 (plasmid) [Paraburkholderia terrae]|uniref:Uncharacterized domain-containing protein n=1 Tax=Paraburkholderia terrae TaxID=311230 RepID=A0ABM7U3B0_9BURK|nr:TraI domain-containing protein [Paraburkholderia terrae]BCZ85482.1 hypothetical protein PTKU64_91570 [Paraburkholderia terrae]
MSLHQNIDASALVDQYQRRVDLIGQCANEANKAEFERKWLSVLRACAAWFSSLPLSATLYHGPGGAFRCTVETAFFAMRLAGGQKFGTNLSSEKRRRIEPQYNYAVFLAAVCSRLDEPYRHFQIERDSDRAVWNPSVHGSVGTWLGASAYRVMVRDQLLPVERMRTGMLAQMLVGSELLSWLDGEVQSEMFGAINPVMQPQGVESLLHKVVRQAVNVADDADRKAQRGVFAPVSYTVPTAVQVAAELQPVVAPAPAPAHAPPPGSSLAAAASGPTPVAEPTAAKSTDASEKPSTTESADSPVEASQRAPVESASLSVQPPSEPAPASSAANQWSLHAAVGIAPGQEAASEAPVQKPIDPTAMRVTPRAAPAHEKAAAPTGFDDVLKGMPNSVREFFTALREDVASGAAKGVEWNDKGLVVAKRLIGSYGLASSTLVEHMRKRSLMVADASTDITLAPRAGQLILDRPA